MTLLRGLYCWLIINPRLETTDVSLVLYSLKNSFDCIVGAGVGIRTFKNCGDVSRYHFFLDNSLVVFYGFYEVKVAKSPFFSALTLQYLEKNLGSKIQLQVGF